MRKGIICAMGLAMGFMACSVDNYEKGDGKYSLMRGDFAEAHVNGELEVDYITTDDGDLLPLSKHVKPSWVETADTVYRCMLYYNKVEGSDGQQAEVISIGQVPCPSFKSSASFEIKSDPVRLESIWMSRSRRYLNIRLSVMTAITDDTTAVQKLALVSDTILVHADSTSTRQVRLHHDQGNVPEYFSTQVYLSIPTDSIAADSIRISINTYDSEVVKTFGSWH